MSTESMPLDLPPSGSCVVNFVPVKHYRHEVAVQGFSLQHSHWMSSEDGVVNSVLSIEIRSADFMAAAKFNLWQVSPVDLRRMSSALRRAADSLESHQRQIGGAV